jgi:hypothetical protein
MKLVNLDKKKKKKRRKVEVGDFKKRSLSVMMDEDGGILKLNFVSICLSNINKVKRKPHFNQATFPFANTTRIIHISLSCC